MTLTYKIVITNELKQGFTVEQVKQRLQKLMRLNEPQVTRLLSQPLTVVKQGVTEPKLEQYKVALEQCGVKYFIKPEEAPIVCHQCGKPIRPLDKRCKACGALSLAVEASRKKVMVALSVVIAVLITLFSVVATMVVSKDPKSPAVVESQISQPIPAPDTREPAKQTLRSSQSGAFIEVPTHWQLGVTENPLASIDAGDTSQQTYVMLVEESRAELEGYTLQEFAQGMAEVYVEEFSEDARLISLREVKLEQAVTHIAVIESTIDGSALTYMMAFYFSGERAFQVIAWTASQTFSVHESLLYDVVTSLGL